MEELLQTEIPPLALLLLSAIMALIYFYVVRGPNLKNLRETGDEKRKEPESETRFEEQGTYCPSEMNRAKFVAIAAAAKVALERRKGGSDKPDKRTA